MNSGYEAIIAGEIPALEQEILNSSFRRAAIQKAGLFTWASLDTKEENYLIAVRSCLEFCKEVIYVPKMLVDVLNDLENLLEIESKLLGKMKPIKEKHREKSSEPLSDDGTGERFVAENFSERFHAIRNIIFYRRTIVLQNLFRQLKTLLPELPSWIGVSISNPGARSKFTRIANKCAEEKRHRRPLNLLVARGVQIEGDIYEEFVVLLRPICDDLGRAFANGRSGTPTSLSSHSVVDQAFQRILEAISNQKQVDKRVEELAERCRALKMAFPDAEKQIEKLFRQEVDNLKR